MVASVSRLNQLSLQELSRIQEIVNRIITAKPYNQARKEYYEAHRAVNDLGIAVPPSLKNTMQAVGWPGLVVDSLDERLDIDGLDIPGADPDDLLVNEIYEDNELDLLYSEAHIDALIHGIAFLAATEGDQDEGEPETLITFESPENFSGIYNPRARRLTHAVGVQWDERGVKSGRLYQAGEDIEFARDASAIGGWTVTRRIEHKRARPMVRRLVNRTRGNRQWGRSEITRPIISYTESAARTLLGAEVNREFYLSPQRWIMGADEKQFQDAQGNPTNPWKSYMGRFLALTRDEDGEVPSVGQFPVGSPTPYIELVKMYSQLVAGEAGLPSDYLGFVSENPTSADSIRATEARHVKRAERRQTAFGAAWKGILLDAVEIRQGSIPDDLRGLAINWRDASTPTSAAAADRAMKLVGSEILPKTSKVLLRDLGYSDTEIRIIEEERKAEQGSDLAMALRANAMQAVAGNPRVQEMSNRTAPTNATEE